MTTIDVQGTAHDLEPAGADPKLAPAIAQAIRATGHPVAQPPTWLVQVTASDPVAAIGVVGAGACENGDRIDALGDRVSALEVGMSERFVRTETLLEERLPERR